MSETLPQGWVWSTLGEVADYGKTIKVEPSDIKPNEWVLELEDIEKDSSKLLQRVFNSDRQSKSAKNRFFKGDALYGKLRPYLNKVLIADKDGVCTTEIIPITAPEGVDSRYLFYSLKRPDFIDYVSSISHGLNMPRLGTQAGKEAEFPLAPLNEQKRIADKLDQLLADVDSCKTRLDTIPGIIKRFRQSVLAAATSGELTADWREENLRCDRAKLPGIPDGWKQLQIKDLIIDKPRNGYSPKSVEFETATRSLTLTATTSGRFNPSHSKYINETIPKESHLWLKPGDILIQRANTIEYVGVSAIYDISDGNFIYPDLMMKCRANESVLTQYLYYILSSQPVRSYFRENATGTAGNMPKINQQTVQTAPAVVPPIEEQQEIVRRVEALFAVAERLEARYQAARTQVDQLTPSLLAKAFRGELVQQDPNDEPAEKLLERMRGAQTKQKVKRGTRP